MINTLITSQTRIKLLKKFFLNSSTRAHLRGLESEFGESSNAIRVELNRFEGAGLLKSYTDGNKKLYHANNDHPLYRDIHSIILKEAGIDIIIENVISRIGNLESVYLTGEFARGRDSEVIDIIIVGDRIDDSYLAAKVSQAEQAIGRKVSYSVVSTGLEEDYLKDYCAADLVMLWSRDGKRKVTPVK